jgi:hypothetical protein
MSQIKIEIALTERRAGSGYAKIGAREVPIFASYGDRQWLVHETGGAEGAGRSLESAAKLFARDFGCSGGTLEITAEYDAFRQWTVEL